ncbi:hypothetical protein J4Q44_G00140420 [Coregonus suidteri]|uniref:PX domain-containing protein n=1 Tax=Coregonus suidteri TaxID=861788 RepID=A0AAN8QZB2_9TELE
MSAGTAKSLASSGQKPIQEICHPLGAEEAAAAGVLTPSPDVGNTTSSIGEKEPSLPNGTPVETSSPASSSSLLNRLQLDDDLDGETRDLFVTVDDPKKHVSTMETYITYRVVTKTTRVEFDLPECSTTRVEFDLPEYSVRRRYQDFDWLRTKLEDSQPTHLIPPLPEKFVMKGVVDRFSEEFVETRRKALDKFLKRVADHPVLSFNQHLNAFLSTKVEYLVELREYGPVYATWAAVEAELQEPLEGVSGCIANCSSALDQLTEDMSEDFLPVLREYVLYIESMKTVLKKRDNVQAEYEAKLEAAALRKEERPTAKKSVPLSPLYTRDKTSALQVACPHPLQQVALLRGSLSFHYYRTSSHRRPKQRKTETASCPLEHSGKWT